MNQDQRLHKALGHLRICWSQLISTVGKAVGSAKFEAGGSTRRCRIVGMSPFIKFNVVVFDILLFNGTKGEWKVWKTSFIKHPYANDPRKRWCQYPSQFQMQTPSVGYSEQHACRVELACQQKLSSQPVSINTVSSPQSVVEYGSKPQPRVGGNVLEGAVDPNSHAHRGRWSGVEF